MAKGIVTEVNWNPAMHSAKMFEPESATPHAKFMSKACQKTKSFFQVTRNRQAKATTN